MPEAPEATPFTALGRGNGFPFCIPRITNSEKAEIEDMPFGPNGGLLRFRETTMGEASALFWNSFTAALPETDAEIRIGQNSYVDKTVMTPIERFCVNYVSDTFSYTVVDPSFGDDFVSLISTPIGLEAQEFLEMEDTYNRFVLLNILWNSDESKLLMLYLCGEFADDEVTRISDLAYPYFEFYTYP